MKTVSPSLAKGLLVGLVLPSSSKLTKITTVGTSTAICGFSRIFLVAIM